MYEGMIAESIRIEGYGGDIIDAYLARPLGGGPYPSVVVNHHMPGWDESTKEITRKLAYHGYVAILPNLHHRAGPGTPAEQAAAVRAAGGNPDAQTRTPNSSGTRRGRSRTWSACRTSPAKSG